jgi:enamine deaminase RidA (YjgF/YER057c/UK114 family)
VAIERFGSGGPFEESVGYSRVVRAGPFVLVAGTTAMGPDDVVFGLGDVYAQTVYALDAVEEALAQAGATLEQVVRTRLFVTDIGRSDEIGRAHRERFGAIRPAAAMLEVQALVDPRMLVEIEADAYVG